MNHLQADSLFDPTNALDAIIEAIADDELVHQAGANHRLFGLVTAAGLIAEQLRELAVRWVEATGPGAKAGERTGQKDGTRECSEARLMSMRSRDRRQASRAKDRARWHEERKTRHGHDRTGEGSRHHNHQGGRRDGP